MCVLWFLLVRCAGYLYSIGLSYNPTHSAISQRHDEGGDCDILIHGYTAGIRDIHRHYLVSQKFYLFDRMRCYVPTTDSGGAHATRTPATERTG